MPESQTAEHVAAFDLGAAEEDGEFVRYPDSLLFRAGDYPRQKFSMTPDEIRAAAASFARPVPNELEHIESVHKIPTILDGKLGHVAEVRASEDGAELRGTVLIPKWLDRVWAGAQKQVSCVFGRDRKELQKLGLVVKGQVPGAALVAAFSAAHPEVADDPEVAAFTPRKISPAATAHMQSIHDHVSAVDPSVCAMASAAFADRPKQIKAFKAVHDTAVAHGAVCKGVAAMSATSSPAPERKPMGFLDHMNRTYFGGKAKNVPALSPEVDAELAAAFADLEPEAKHGSKVIEAAVLAPAVAVAFSDTPEGKAMQAKLDKQAADLARLEAEADANRRAATGRDAAAFAASLVQDRRIPAAFAQDVAALYARLADDDRSASAVVAFSGKDGATAEGGRVDALVAAFSRIPTPAEQYHAAVGGKAVFGVEGVARGGESETPDPANVARLMKLAGVSA